MNEIINFMLANGIPVWDIIKLFYLLIFLIYLIFTLIVARQIQLMSRTLNGSFNPIIHSIGVILVLSALLALVTSYLVL